jgi:hypothetical protein
MFKKVFYCMALLALAFGGVLGQAGATAPAEPDKAVLAWEQANADSFGQSGNTQIESLVEYKGGVFAGTRNSGSGGQIWYLPPDGYWGQLMPPGLADSNNIAISALSVTGDYLYMGTTNNVTGAEVWKTDWSIHTQINSDGFGDAHNTVARTITGINGSAGGDYTDFIQVGTQNSTSGAQLWETDQTNWYTGTLNGFDDANNTVVASGCAPYDAFFGTTNAVSGTQIIKYDWGYGTWTLFEDGGFGNPHNWSASSIVCLDDYVLVGTYNEIDGAEIWRYDYNTDNWSAVVSGGFGDAHNIDMRTMKAVGEYIYAGTNNSVSGGEVWRSLLHGDTGTWEQVNLDGFGDSNNTAVTALAGVGRYLYAGTHNPTTGTELWRVELNGPDSSFLVYDSNAIRTTAHAGAYNSHDQQYLTMWQNYVEGEFGDTLQARRLSLTGNLIGSSFMVSSEATASQSPGCPRLAYDSLHNRYLAVWLFTEESTTGVRARLISASGALLGNEIDIDGNGSISQWGCPEVAYSPASDRYLVTYLKKEDYGNHQIFARALLADGTVDAANILIHEYTEEADNFQRLGLAYNPDRDEFLVVWGADAVMEIYGQRIKMAGGVAKQGLPFLISDDTDGIADEHPAVGAIATTDGNGEYLVVWSAGLYTPGQTIKSRLVSGLGVLDVDWIIICDSANSICGSRPQVAGLANGRFEIIWAGWEQDRYGVFTAGQGIDAEGNPLGTKTWLTGENQSVFVDIYPGPHNMALVLYHDYPPYYGAMDLDGYIFGLGTNKNYLPQLSK